MNSFWKRLVSLCHDVHLNAKHIPGLHSKLPDSMSRLQVQTFKQPARAHISINSPQISLTIYNHSISINSFVSTAFTSSALVYSHLSAGLELFRHFYNSVFQHPFFHFLSHHLSYGPVYITVLMPHPL